MFSDEEISVFLDELEEKIQVLNENILVLEREGGSQEALQEIFRAAHTIKGSSAVMGYDKMASLTHEIENLFDQMRKGLLPVSGPLVDTLFMALDTLQILRDEIIGKDVSVDIEQVVTSLRQFQGAGSAPAPGGKPESGKGVLKQPAAIVEGGLEAVDEDVIREAEMKGFQAFWINVELESSCQMKSVRAFLVFETLQQMGEVIKSQPSADDIQEGNFDAGFRVVLLTGEDPDRIRNLLMTVSEVAKVEVSQIKLAAGQEVREQVAAGARAEKTEQAAKADHEVKTVQTVRVDVQKLDTLMNLVGELVIDRTRLNRFAEIFEGRFGSGSGDMVETMNEISSHLGQVAGDLQEQIMKARMLPVAQVFNRFPRMVRDLAQKLNKEVNFIVEGHETELDRNVIEVIGDPLIHLIRNSLDHGIEGPEERVKLGKPRNGTLKLKASYMENHIIITVQDDGKGMDPARLRAKAVEKGLIDSEVAQRMSDPEALNLIFMPGFSTVTKVSDLSGRGVGMDIVRNHIDQINGIIDLVSAPGVGTTITIKLPLTLAIIRALMVELGNEQFAFPLTNVVETISVKAEEIKKVKHNEVILVRGRVLPLVRLSDIFERESCAEMDRLFVVVLGIGEKKVGVIVDKLLGELEIVIKSLGDYLGKVPCLSGATILGDGQVALIVDVRSLVKEIGVEEAVYAAS
ncbi:chemotaxis protein CheA [Pelotomaculum isophthalicicum JI]|uniref:Chemotaxis protein CheA n=1 Tax=Pelotomaculum isophthalicicum JI TaxID=947010 RepID=A0A9X4JUF7_9FIRM|nr:chemotaxis protein CheA [Pelotomaculum isophthalicicum]MDF9409130.1 chemotaxis protein CheA [Pelotomaculum isophthalicicum JI]